MDKAQIEFCREPLREAIRFRSDIRASDVDALCDQAMRAEHAECERDEAKAALRGVVTATDALAVGTAEGDCLPEDDPLVVAVDEAWAEARRVVEGER